MDEKRRNARSGRDDRGIRRSARKNGLPDQMRILYQKDAVRLLRLKVKQAGGQSEWAKKSGASRSLISMVLNGDRPPSNKKILNALRLRRAVGFLPYSK
jgi:hypothetical protein